MPRPIKVRLLPHDPRWAEMAAVETSRLRAAASALSQVHHIGSTAIPGIAAKPVIDLLGVASDLETLDQQSEAIEALGYSAHGEYGLAGRRYFKFDDPSSGARLFQLHVYAQGDPSLTRHLAFRDQLRANPEVAAAYEAEKQRCAALHPDDSHAYSDCKGAWIAKVEAEALAARR